MNRWPFALAGIDMPRFVTRPTVHRPGSGKDRVLALLDAEPDTWHDCEAVAQRVSLCRNSVYKVFVALTLRGHCVRKLTIVGKHARSVFKKTGGKP